MTEPPTLEGRMLAALRAGQTAAKNRQGRADNPHRYQAPTAVERVLARMWARGWDHATDAPTEPDQGDPTD